jgi:hypothetical protein
MDQFSDHFSLLHVRESAKVVRIDVRDSSRPTITDGTVLGHQLESARNRRQCTAGSHRANIRAFDTAHGFAAARPD